MTNNNSLESIAESAAQTHSALATRHESYARSIEDLQEAYLESDMHILLKDDQDLTPKILHMFGCLETANSGFTIAKSYLEKLLDAWKIVLETPDGVTGISYIESQRRQLQTFLASDAYKSKAAREKLLEALKDLRNNFQKGNTQLALAELLNDGAVIAEIQQSPAGAKNAL